MRVSLTGSAENLEHLKSQNSKLTGVNEASQPSTDFLIERIKSPKNKHVISLASNLEKRIRLHTVGTQDNSTDYHTWKSKIQKLLPSSKFEIFEQLINEPVPTLDLTETIFDELAKIFEASNKTIYSSYNTNSNLKQEQFDQYFDHVTYFKDEVYDMFKVAPNSFIVVDTKLELDKDGNEQPIPYFVHLDSIIDCDVNRDGTTNYIIFKTSEDRAVGIDKFNYYVFDLTTKEPSILAGYPSAHKLKDHLDRPYTPAFLIYPDFLNVTDNLATNSPLTKSLGNLDWLLFWSVSKRYLDLYAPFPIYVSYEQDCTYVDPSSGQACNNGLISIPSDDLENPATNIPCPHCSKTKMFGAGSEVTVPAPQTKDDPNLIDAVKVIPAEKNSIEYVTKEEERLKQSIYYSVLGKTSTPIENFSQSVTQLDLSTESRKAVLLHVKSFFERTHKKVLYTMNKIKYGDDFIDCYVDYGDNYFLTTQEQETEKYKKLKDSGAPESVLHASLETLIATTYKTSPHTALLQQVYLEVEPYQTLSIEAVMKLAGQNLIPLSKAVAKIHFTDFIENFENEHQALISMVETGNEDKAKVVKLLKTKLDLYAKEIMKQIKSENPVDDEESPDMAKPSSVSKRKYREETKSDD
jgi:uncharacterized protein YutD